MHAASKNVTAITIINEIIASAIVMKISFLYKHEYRKLMFIDLESLRPHFSLSALVTVLLPNLIRREDRLLNHILLFWHQDYGVVNHGLFYSMKMEPLVAIQNNVWLRFSTTVSLNGINISFRIIFDMA